MPEPDFEHVALMCDVSFAYKGKVYVTREDSPSGMYYYDPSSRSYYIGDVKVTEFYIKAGSCVNFGTYCRFMRGADFNHLRSRSYQQKNLKHNVREGKRLERIAKEVFPTVTVTPILKKR
ncbi:MAG: hypothetical protein KBT05_00725 [Bacteroidales bacterium]|nr:hypothetical protein [Candidatus Cryptobacteroides caccocaballi]